MALRITFPCKSWKRTQLLIERKKQPRQASDLKDCFIIYHAVLFPFYRFIKQRRSATNSTPNSTPALSMATSRKAGVRVPLKY